MNISSVVLRILPERLNEVRSTLMAWPGVDIHAVTENSRMAVTLEDESSRLAADRFLALHDIPGILAITLVYQYDDVDESHALPPGLTLQPE